MIRQKKVELSIWSNFYFFISSKTEKKKEIQMYPLFTDITGNKTMFEIVLLHTPRFNSFYNEMYFGRFYMTSTVHLLGFRPNWISTSSSWNRFVNGAPRLIIPIKQEYEIK
jgi:hypothetical protein